LICSKRKNGLNAGLFGIHVTAECKHDAKTEPRIMLFYIYAESGAERIHSEPRLSAGVSAPMANATFSSNNCHNS
jgi:hypothetical protein